MTQVIVCDDCGEPIDKSKPYYELVGSLVQDAGDPPVPTVAQPGKQMHYHQDCLPGEVLEPAGPGIDNTLPEPEPVEDGKDKPDK